MRIEWHFSRPGAARRAASPAVLGAILLAFATACTPAPSVVPTTAGATATGVRGAVLAGPTCPIGQPGESPCVRAVGGAVIVALDPGGREAGRTTSDAAGAYFLPLAPGSYRIVAASMAGLMSAPAEVSVTVTDGPPVALDLTYDTGLR